MDDTGITAILPEDLADKFNIYFSSVFTSENKTTVTSADEVYKGQESDKLLDIQIESGKVKKCLTGSDVIKLVVRMSCLLGCLLS